MPSDDSRIRLALHALAGPIAEFRAAIAGALAQAEATLARATADPGARAERAAAELGAFATGRIRAAAFAELTARSGLPDAAGRSALARAVAVLRGVADRGDALFTAEVPPGGIPGAVIGAALAEAGRAFGAAIVAERVRGGSYRPESDDRLLEPLSFTTWNRAERRFAPPLVVSVEGADLNAGALTEFCDGRAKLVLVVRGGCAPAALARLITPGTFVVQTADASGLDRMAAFDGPSVAALVPEGAARFLHDPAGGRESWQRLSIAHLPEAPRRGLGPQSAWQMAEDLHQLAALARTPFAMPAPAGAAPSPALGETEAVDRLAAWLLSGAEPPAA
jgi:hypothetical protein